MHMGHWPPSQEGLRSLIESQESSLLEKKQKWYGLSEQRGTGTLLKHLLAIANSTDPDTPGHMLFGMADARHGGVIVGIPEAPDDGKLVHALCHYTQPVPEPVRAASRRKERSCPVKPLTQIVRPPLPSPPHRRRPTVYCRTCFLS